MNKQARIEALSALGSELSALDDPEWPAVLSKAQAENGWFTAENVERAVRAIAAQFLQEEKLYHWLDRYARLNGPTNKDIGLVLAGNIPLVGFHDWLCVFASGHRARIKLSEKDKVLLPWLVKKLGDIAFESWAFTEFVPEGGVLRSFDAVIATGSDNSARYFDYYFGKYPHIIRRNRNSVAVLDGTESQSDLMALGRDIFSYFGLGCRNVSKLFVPAGYVFDPLLETLHEYRDIVLHHKYKNNFDYNFTLFLLNNAPFLNNGCLLLREDASLAARIATLHYEHYESLEDLEAKLTAQLPGIQCGVGNLRLSSVQLLPFGQTQFPSLDDYADGVDVPAFLENV